MDPSQYPRPDLTSVGPYDKDKTWGLAVAILSSLGVCCGLGVAGVGGVIGAVGTQIGREPASNDPAATLLTTGFGSIVAILGFGIMVCSAVQVAGGFGIMASRRWGFVLTAVFAGLSVLFHLPGVVHGTGVVGVAIHGAILYYCWARLSGKEGPSPL